MTSRLLTILAFDLTWWPSFWPQVTQFQTWLRLHKGKHSEQVSFRLGQNCDFWSVNKLIVDNACWTTNEGQRVITISHPEHLLRWAKIKWKIPILHCQVYNKGSYQTVPLCWLIWSFNMYMCWRHVFTWQSSFISWFGDNSGIIFFLFHHKNVCCGYSVESPCQGASDEYQHVFYGEYLRKITLELSSNTLLQQVLW